MVRCCYAYALLNAALGTVWLLTIQYIWNLAELGAASKSFGDLTSSERADVDSWRESASTQMSQLPLGVMITKILL